MVHRQITDVFKEYTYDEMTQMLHNWLDPENSEESESAPAKEAKPESANKSSISEASSVAKVDDVASAFDSLFNE